MASHGSERLPVAPFSLDVLADLHAGVLDDAVSARLWPLLEKDPHALEVIAALDAVSATLSEVGESTGTGAVPSDIAERTDRTLAEAADGSRVVVAPLATKPHATPPQAAGRSTSRTRKRVFMVAASAVVLAGAAVTTVLLATSALTNTSDGSSDPDVVAAGPDTLVIDSSRLDSSVAHAVMSDRRTVSLLDSGRLPDCLAANGFNTDSTVLGAASIQLDGRPGVMLVLPRGGPAEGLTLLAVGTECGAGEPQTLVRRDIS